MPNVSKDVTDRNRTSPFAFTGNKFEFRMLGSMDSIAPPNIVLNTIVAESFSEASDIIEKANDKDATINEIIHNNFKNHKRVIFNGNGYSKEWEEEAKRRGLPNIANMLDSLEALENDDNIELFEKFGVFSKSEIISRADIQRELYAKLTNIEARVMIDVAGKHIIPAVVRYTRELADSVNSLKKAKVDYRVQKELLENVSALLADTKKAWDELSKVTDKGGSLNIEDKQTAFYYRDIVRPAMKELRNPIDGLEMIVDKSIWPMPSYGDLLFDS